MNERELPAHRQEDIIYSAIGDRENQPHLVIDLPGVDYPHSGQRLRHLPLVLLVSRGFGILLDGSSHDPVAGRYGEGGELVGHAPPLAILARMPTDSSLLPLTAALIAVSSSYMKTTLARTLQGKSKSLATAARVSISSWGSPRTAA